MLKMFSIEYDYVTHMMPPGWIEPFATGDLALSEPGYRYKDDGTGDKYRALAFLLQRIRSPLLGMEKYAEGGNMSGSATTAGSSISSRYRRFISHN